jgi:hypothetical protein
LLGVEVRELVIGARRDGMAQRLSCRLRSHRFRPKASFAATGSSKTPSLFR